MKKKKLLDIADMLERYRKNKKIIFDMDIWMSEDTCGTVCCAIGMAKIKGMLPETFGNNELDNWLPGSYSQIGNLFGIGPEEAKDLFHPARYHVSYKQDVTPKMVAKRIREFVKEK